MRNHQKPIGFILEFDRKSWNFIALNGWKESINEYYIYWVNSLNKYEKLMVEVGRTLTFFNGVL